MAFIVTASSFPTGNTPETVNVDLTYVEGSLTVPITSAIVNANHDTASWDAYSWNGAGVAGFLSTGIGIECEAINDPLSGLMYVMRSATQDGVPAYNVPIEAPGLNNGAAVGVAIDRGRSASAVNVALAQGVGAELVESVGQKAVLHQPAATVLATAAIAAGAAGVRHVAKTITATAAVTTLLAAGVTLIVNLRDGASGAGTVLWSDSLTLPNGAAIGTMAKVVVPNLAMVGTAATAMTLEFAASNANIQQSVCLTYYDAI